MANHTTQMITPQPVKNNKVNQSIKAVTLRCKVGKAKAAMAANAGKASNKVRSEAAVMALATVTVTIMVMGQITCRDPGRRPHWRRQLQADHSANGQQGQVNHSINSSQRRISDADKGQVRKRQRHKPHSFTKPARSNKAKPKRPANARRWVVESSGVAANITSKAAKPKAMAKVGAPLSANTDKPSTLVKHPRQGLLRSKAMPMNKALLPPSCTSMGEVSCRGTARPKQAINANKPASARVRA
jgi:hypothetical protein